MSAMPNAPVIIKRKKVVVSAGHHGGAWKVAYADFVTAMMAFFMLMWLLNATTEQQRKGLADYFSPTIPVNRISGGGDGAFGGDSVFSEETLAQNGTGASSTKPTDANLARGDTGLNQSIEETSGEAQAMLAVQSILNGENSQIQIQETVLNHISTRLSDEGLVIEVFDHETEPLFKAGSAAPTNIMRDIAGALALVFGLVRNEIAINGHIRAHPVVLAENPVWKLSSARADQLRKLLENDGLPSRRVQRVSGYADRRTVDSDPMATRNNRLELVLLYSE